MQTLKEALATALECHRSGNLAEAERAYRLILQSNPTDARVLALLGTALLGQGKFPEAAASLQLSLRLDPNHGDIWNNLGVASARLGKLDEAIASYQQALRLRPNDADTLYNLGDALRKQYRLMEAEDCFRRALQLRPQYDKAWNALGVTVADQGRLDEAVDIFQQALRHNSASAESCNNLALILAKQNKYDAAADCFRKAVQHNPANPEFYNNLGLLLVKQNLHDRFGQTDPTRGQNASAGSKAAARLEEAVTAYQRALQLKPDSFELHQNLGVGFHEADRFDEAVAHYQAALRLKPDQAQAHYNLAIALSDMTRFHEAVASFREATRLEPNHADAHKALGLTLLTVGEFAEGWREYEWRLRCGDGGARSWPQPQWDGSSPAGKTILLHAEQGFGDTIQFIRYAALVKRFGGTIWLECQKPIFQLLSSYREIDRLFGRGSAIPPFDVQAPLLSVPGILGTTLENIPADVPYLFADPKLVETWRGRLAEIKEFKIGFNWQGNVFYRRSRHRSVPLQEMLRLIELPGARLICLQMAPEKAQLRDFPGTDSIFVPGDDFNVSTGPFLDSAAVLMNLDLFVTSDTAIAHLAGALGVPVWVALPFNADWRWFEDPDASPWYPSMRLFRQKRFGDWGEVFDRILAELKKIIPGN